MFENRSLKLDLFALSLIAVAALIAAALVSYDPLDPPSTLADPPAETIHNACGRAGAFAADFLYRGLGYLAYYLAGSLGAVGVLMTVRRDVNQPIVRSVGWAATLAALSTLATLALPDITPGPEVGAGGYLGVMGAALLETHFALAGAYIIAISTLVAGLLLCTDYLLLRLVAVAARVPGAGLLRIGRLARSRSRDVVKRAKNVEGDEQGQLEGEQEEEYEYDYEDDDGEFADEDWEEEEPEEDDEPAELTVRTPDSKTEAAPEAPEVAGHEDADAESPEDQAPAPPAKLRSKLSEALRIKKRGNAAKPANQSSQRSEREEVIDQLDAAEIQGVDDVDYELPPLDLLLESDDVCYEAHEKEVRRKAKILERTFRSFGLNVKVVEIETGPVIAQYEVQLEAGLRLSRITGLADDLAIALRVPSVRIVAPIPGKNTVGIEVPNENRQLVRLREVIEETNGRAKLMKIPVYLGKDVSGNPLVVDLTAMPHLLIAGRTGTGKSVCLNSIILSMLMSRGPDEVRMLMIDPKMVELSGYKKLPHLMHPVVTDMRKAEAILAWAVDKMEERYQLLARAGVRHVSVFNQLSEEELRERIEPTSEAEWEQIPRTLPFIVIVADEMADLMMTAGKDVEQHIIRLAQKSRAVGIHLILATQKPTVDVITGLIKSNLPARIAFQVASRTDSRVVLDEMGADKLLGNGDMLFLSPGTSQLLRGQGTFLSDDEITRVTDFVGTDDPQFARELIELKTKDEEEAAQPGGKLKNRDELYEAAVDVVVREQRGSVSLLQRCLGIGYGRAARLIDYMAEDGIVGEYNGSQAREVLLSVSDWETMSGDGSEGDSESSDEPSGPLTAATVAPKPRRSNRIIPGTDEPSDLDQDDPPARRIDRGGQRSPTPSFTGTPVEAHALLESPTGGATSTAAVLTAPWEEQEAEQLAAEEGEPESLLDYIEDGDGDAPPSQPDDASDACFESHPTEQDATDAACAVGREDEVESSDIVASLQQAGDDEAADPENGALADDHPSSDGAAYDDAEASAVHAQEDAASDDAVDDCENAEDESDWEYEDEEEASDDDDDQPWEYEEEDEADDDCEWEYEEDESEDETADVGDQEALHGEDVNADDQEEWEYEEDEDDGPWEEEEAGEWEDADAEGDEPVAQPKD